MANDRLESFTAFDFKGQDALISVALRGSRPEKRSGDMNDLYWLTDEQMAKLSPFFPMSHGKPRVDDRRELSGIAVGLADGRVTFNLCAAHGDGICRRHHRRDPRRADRLRDPPQGCNCLTNGLNPDSPPRQCTAHVFDQPICVCADTRFSG